MPWTAHASARTHPFHAQAGVSHHHKKSSPRTFHWDDISGFDWKKTRGYHLLYPKSVPDPHPHAVHHPPKRAVKRQSTASVGMAKRSRGKRSKAYTKRRKVIYKKKRAGRVGGRRKLAVVGLHWPPSVMRWTGTTQVTLNPSATANDDTNVAVFSLEGGVVGHVHTFFGGTAGGTGSTVPFATPRNFATISALYEQMRIVKVRYVVTFINQNDFEGFKIYFWTNTTTNRDEPIKLMGIGTAKPGSAAPWDTVEGVTHILDQARSVSRSFVGSANDVRGSHKNISVTLGKTAFTGPDRWGVRMLGGRFNTDGTGPGISMSHAVGSIDDAFGLSPMLHFAVTNETREASTPDMTSIQVKKYVTVEFFNRVMDVGAA